VTEAKSVGKRKVKAHKSRVKAVLFDFAGTLVEIDNHEIPSAMKAVLDDCGVNRCLEDVSQAWVKSWEGLDFQKLASLLEDFLGSMESAGSSQPSNTVP
jgi:beta-phosphoglucomutase-like phosphatase (HAD superfamily)